MLRIFKEFISDFRNYAKYNIDGWRTSQKERLISQMLLTAHSLEKGMCFEEKKHNWGEAKAKALCKLICHYEKYGADEYLSLALNVLNKYSSDDYSSKDKGLLNSNFTVGTFYCNKCFGTFYLGSNNTFIHTAL